MWGYHYMNGFWGGDLMMSLFWWILIICIIVSLLSKKSCKSCKNPSGEDKKEAPVDILKRRYASGEIKREEFLQMKKDLDQVVDGD